MKTLKGIKLSSGCAVGRVFYYTEEHPKPVRVAIDAASAESETERVLQAMKKTSESMLEKAKNVGGEAEAIMEAHAEIASDEMLFESISELIRVTKTGAEFAVWRVYEDSARELEDSGDPFCAARAKDLRDVCAQLIFTLQGRVQKLGFPRGAIIAAEDISPSAAAVLESCAVAGIVCSSAVQTSHAAIMARAAGIPCVTGIDGIARLFTDAHTAAVDADAGEVIVDPDEETLIRYNRRIGELAAETERARTSARDPISFDGERFDILLNVASPEDCLPAAMEICDGIGLYRTEYLYIHSEKIPDFGQQLAEYKRLIENANGKPITVRTLDIGADKRAASIKMDKEDNPALGLRGIRLCFEYRELFMTQLKALLAASAFGRLRIMFPMVSTVSDITAARDCLEEAKKELAASAIRYSDEVDIGVMLEVPSALITADSVARHVDFASVGTNDLCQYTMAADRMNGRVGGYTDPFSPAVLRLISYAACEFKKQGKKLSVCGESASNPLSALLLCGLGVSSLSMSAPSVPKVKLALKNRERGKLSEVARHCLSLDDPEKIKEYAERNLKL